MMKSLDRLLRPSSIAVIGGGVWCENVVEQCRKIGFAGEVWSVHPKHKTLAGVKSFRRIADLPRVPDAAFVGVNRVATIDVVHELSEVGAGGAICFASGFREASNEDAQAGTLQTALIDAAGDMPIIGPNCYGFLNYLDGAALWPDQHGGKRVQNGVAIITQSSNIAINLTMQKRGLPLAYIVTAGNQAQTTLTDIGATILADPRVTALGLHIEGIGDVRGLEELAAKARKLGKPIVALKVGKSAQAQAATISHTASLAGSGTGARALLSRLGIGQVSTLSELLETLKLLHVTGPLKSARIASMSCSGGEASLIADAAHNTKVTFPELSAAQSENLRSILGPLVALANPLDYQTRIWGDEDAMARCFAATMTPEMALGIVILDFPRTDRCSADEWDIVVNAVARTKDEIRRPMALLGSIPEAMPEEIAERVIRLGLVPFCGMSEAIAAINAAAEIGTSTVDPNPVLLPQRTTNELTLSEHEAKAVLATFGLRIPTSLRVGNPVDAGKAAMEIGFPVVLKGEGIAHKTEFDAVRISLRSADEVAQSAIEIPCAHFLVEEMIVDVVAELLLGVVCDSAHGYLLTLAAGGTLTELMDDSVSLLIPASRKSVELALEQLKINALLRGYRGAKAANIEAILESVDAVQTYVLAHRPCEVEINPLMCGTASAVAADALIKIGEHDA